jgi:hypothetical protein
MNLKRVAIFIAIAGLAGCGQVAPLEPRPGSALPVKPLMASATPTPEQLLTPPPYARPDRVDELVKRSAPRKVDRFDLPPPDGVAAPPLIEEEESSSNQAGPVTPE